MPKIRSVACGNHHTPQGPNGPLPGMALAGGMVFRGPWGTSVSANLTPSGRLQGYSDAEVKQLITTGVRPDRSHLLPPMGTDDYTKMKASDLDALVANLRSLPPK